MTSMASWRSERLKLVRNLGCAAGVGAGCTAAAASSAVAGAAALPARSTPCAASFQFIAAGESMTGLVEKDSLETGSGEINSAASSSDAPMSDALGSGKPCPDKLGSELMPRAAASLKTFSTTAASNSGGAGGATPSNSSSLAIRYPSSFRLPMMSSAASRTSGRMEMEPSCHTRWSVRLPGLERKFSNDGPLDVLHFT
jgi:hypothetical protein